MPAETTAVRFYNRPLVRKQFAPTALLMFLCRFISFIALLTVCLHPQAYVVMIFAFSLDSLPPVA